MARRKARRIDPTYIRRVLAWYLERHDAPVAHVRRLLMRRVERAVRELEQDRDEAVAAMDEALEDFVRHGMLDDRRWAEQAVERWRRKGVSTRQIRSRLYAKGVPPDVARQALATGDDADPERIAALRYARRRRFGPWRRPDAADDRRDKELASMGRAGFSFALAREILDASEREALEDELLAVQ